MAVPLFLYSQPDVSLKVKVGSERRLIQLKYLFGERKIDEREKEMAVKYHGLKHIGKTNSENTTSCAFRLLFYMRLERKKATRKLRKIQQSIEQTQDETELAKLNEQLKEALVDEAYIKVREEGP